MNINFNKLLKQLNPFIFIATISYILCYILFLYLPTLGTEETIHKINSIQYRSYGGIYTQKNNTNIIQKVIPNKLSDNFKLKAIYETSKNKGYILIQDIRAKESFALSINDTFKGYKLVKIFTNFVLFEKYNRQYKLILIKEPPNKKPLVYQLNNKKFISRKDINFYSKDLNKVWNNLQIIQSDKNEFKIIKIKKNSIFEKLGLKQGDIIESINNNPLKTYNDAFRVYKNINKISHLKLEIKRNNNTLELEYEIN